MVGSAMYSLLQSVGAVPVLGVSPALVGYGGALAVTFWCGLGVLLSLLSDTEECVTVSRRKTVVVCGFFGAVAVFFLLGMAVSGGAGLKYHAPIVRTGHLGEFGIAAKRGVIYAADGSVLAKSVKRYDVRLDDTLDIVDFKIMSDEWLDFIVSCRNGVKHGHDIVIGAMANDQIYNYVGDFIDGAITRDQFWSLMKFKYPTHQIVFCTPQALQCLRFRGSEVVHD